MVSIQLAVVTRLDIAAVVLVKVGESVVHEDAALQDQNHQDQTSFMLQVKRASGQWEWQSHLIGLVQVKRDGAVTRLRAVPAEVLRAVEAGARHIHTCVVDLYMKQKVQ